MQSKLKVLQVHNFYRQRGGEAGVVYTEKNLLEKFGHEVITYYVDSALQTGLLNNLKAAIYMPFSKKSYGAFTKRLVENKPDIVHVHNTFPLITPSIFYACRNLGIPVVYTLHNYRLIYPNALLMHNSKIDLRTIKGSAYSVIKDKVYQNSLIKTFSLSRLIEYHKKKETWHTQVDKFICLTEFAKSVFQEWGLPEQLLTVKPNFIEDPYLKNPNLKPATKREGFLFVGRISKEKGVEDLVNTWVNNELKMPLIIIGDGEMREPLQKVSRNNKNIKWLGFQEKKVIISWLVSVKALILPSIWFEGFPMTLAEALATGTPSIVSNIGSQHTIIKNRVSGLHFQVSSTNDLYEKVLELEENDLLVNELSDGARSSYLKNYTEEINYNQLLGVYKSVMFND